jgi:RNA polymerase sigma factor (sigma-70 family)
MATPKSGSDSTCWTQIRAAAGGSLAEREQFVRRYQPVVEAYFGARWRGSPRLADLGDGVQEVFLECLKEGGALGGAENRRDGGFRAFLHGITRNVAARMEARHAKASRGGLGSDPDHHAEDSLTPDRTFLREWAGLLMEGASELMAERARILGTAAERRIEILRLRFEDNLPVRDIAPRVALSPELAHKQYALARKEFHAALREVVQYHGVREGAAIDEECHSLLELLGE